MEHGPHQRGMIVAVLAMALHSPLGLQLAIRGLVARRTSQNGLQVVLGVLATPLAVPSRLGGEMVFGPNHLWGR